MFHLPSCSCLSQTCTHQAHATACGSYRNGWDGTQQSLRIRKEAGQSVHEIFSGQAVNQEGLPVGSLPTQESHRGRREAKRSCNSDLKLSVRLSPFGCCGDFARECLPPGIIGEKTPCPPCARVYHQRHHNTVGMIQEGIIQEECHKEAVLPGHNKPGSSVAFCVPSPV